MVHPCLELANGPDGIWSYSKLSRQCFFRLPIEHPHTDLISDLHVDLRASAYPVALQSVANVINVGSSPQMVRVAAQPVIATVQDAFTRLNGAFSERVSNAMAQNPTVSPISNVTPKCSVPFGAFVPLPIPTPIGFLYRPPESFNSFRCKVDFLGGYANVLGDLIHALSMFSGLVPDSSYILGRACLF